MSTILVTGANGQLGNEMRDLSKIHLVHNFLFTDIDALDITDAQAVLSFVSDNKVDYIVNCAAYTAVDKAEDDILSCRKINALAVQNLAKAASINEIINNWNRYDEYNEQIDNEKKEIEHFKNKYPYNMPNDEELKINENNLNEMNNINTKKSSIDLTQLEKDKLIKYSSDELSMSF